DAARTAAPAAPPPPAATAGAGGAAGAATAAAPGAAPGMETTFANTARAIADRVKLGGYGSVRLPARSLPDQHPPFTYRRFVLPTDARIAPRLSAYFEIELERFRQIEVEKSLARADGGLQTQEALEATGGSELSLEQGYLQFDFARWLNFRTGA